MKYKSRSRSFFLLMGLVILTLLLPGAVSALSQTAQFTANTVQGNAPPTVQLTAPSITVTSPNGGGTWQRGTSHTVTWSYTGSPGSMVKIVLLKGGTEVGTIKDSSPIGCGGTGSYTWPISSSGTTGSDYKVGIQSISQPTIKDISNNYFTLTPAPATSSITVTSPNGGETWQRGTSHTVTWSYTGSPGSTVKIVLLKGGTEVGTIKDSSPIGCGGTGSYTWPISSSGTTGSDYKVGIQSISQPTIKDISNNYFTLNSAPATSSIAVASPNGGETWQRGTSHTVTWNYKGSPGSTVKIVLLKGGTEVGTIKDTWPIGSGGTGSYTWPIYSSGTTGSDYKVGIQSISQPTTKNTIQSISQPTIQDTSNNYFTLTSGTSDPVIKTPPTAQFTASTTQGQAPMTVQFTDMSVSTGTTTYQWDVNNDGGVDYTTQNPVHMYPVAGNYTVKLTVINASGSDNEIKTNYIKVSSTVIVTPPTEETFGAEPNPTGNPIGGGAGYNDIITETDPRVKYVVSTKDQLINALKSAKSGEIVFVKGDANIDMTGTYATGIPGGVTLASDRGANGSNGGRIFRDRLYPVTLENEYSKIQTFIINGDNVRITGLRIEGPDKGQEALESKGITVKSAFGAIGRSGLVFDNNEMWGWSFSAINLMHSNTSVHHNYIHHCQVGGYGYSVNVGGGFTDIYANLFDYTRHAVCAGGLPGEMYNASYNIHLGHSTENVFDVHPYTGVSPPIAGLRYYIHHNTIYPGVNFPLVRIQAVPVDKVYIYNNKFLASFPYAISQYSLPPARYGNMSVTNNIIGLNNEPGVYYATGPVKYQSW